LLKFPAGANGIGRLVLSGEAIGCLGFSLGRCSAEMKLPGRQ